MKKPETEPKYVRMSKETELGIDALGEFFSLKKVDLIAMLVRDALASNPSAEKILKKLKKEIAT